MLEKYKFIFKNTNSEFILRNILLFNSGCLDYMVLNIIIKKTHNKMTYIFQFKIIIQFE